MYHHVLIPTDGSPCSEKAVAEGLELAKAMGAEVTVIYVVENPISSLWITPESVPYSYELVEDLKKAGNQALDRVAEMAREAGVKAETQLIGDERPLETIVAMSKQHDLVIMGTHGRSGLDRWIIGSVTEGVLRRIHTPLLVIRCDPEGAEKPKQ